MPTKKRKETEKSQTNYSDKVSILADLWMSYRNEPDFEDFIDYCDIALPIAYCINNGIIESTDLAATFINEAFDLLLASLDLEDDGFFDLDEMMKAD